MKRLWTLAVIVCALALTGLVPSGPAWAASYSSATDGNWSADPEDTWGAGVSVYPQNADDTAAIGAHTVAYNVAIDAGVDITLNAGAVLSLKRHFGIDAGNYHDVTVAGASTVWIDSAGADYDVYGQFSGSAGLTLQTGATGSEMRMKMGSPSLSGAVSIPSGLIRMDADQALGTGAVSVASGAILYINATQTVGQPYQVSGLLQTKYDTIGAIELNGGDLRAYWGANNRTIASDIVASGDCRLSAGNWDTRGQFAGTITGSGTMTVALGGEGRSYITLSGDANGYSGNWVIDHLTYLSNTAALGTNAGGSVQVTANGSLGVHAAASGIARDISIDGGFLFGSQTGTAQFAGQVSLAAGTSRFGRSVNYWQNGTLDVTGKVTGDGGILLVGSGAAHDAVKLSNAANNYSGGTDLSGLVGRDYGVFGDTGISGRLVAGAAGCLGTGTVLANRFTLETAADESLTGPAALLFADGRLLLNSTETARVTLQEGGALEVAGGITTLNYAPGTGNIQIFDGAVLHKASIIDAALPVPTRSQVQLSGGGTGGQIYMGFNANPSGTFTVGASANASDLYVGLAAMDKAGSAYDGITLGGGVTINEASAGGGFNLYTALYRGMQLNGTAINATGPMNLQGRGIFDVRGTVLSQVSTVDMNGSGWLKIANTGGIPDGVTVNVNNGVLQILADDGLGDTSTVNINGPSKDGSLGGGLYVDRVYTTGAGRIKVSGGGISVDSNEQASQAALDYTVPSAIAIRHSGTIDVPDGHSIVMQQGGTYATVSLDANLPDGGIIAMVRERGQGDFNMTWNDDITANGDSAGMVSRATVLVNAQLHFADKELFIGGSGPIVLPGYYGQMTSYDNLTGTINLANAANQIGTVEVRGGTLQANSHENLGMASQIDIRSGGRWYMDRHQWHGNIVGLTIVGDGLVEAKQYGPTSIWGFKLEAGTIKPGNSVGDLEFIGGVDFFKTNVGTPEDPVYDYCDIEIEVVGDGGVPGVDHDQIAGNYDFQQLANAELTVALPVPGVGLSPNNLGEMVIMTAPEIGGQFNAAVTGETIGHPGDYHWQAKEGPEKEPLPLVEYRDTDADARIDQVVLLGANLDWTALGGDADLNGVVNYLDLGELATNYDLTQMGWGDGDFTFDGQVDYMDLGILATNYDLTEGSGGAPVPAPAALALLGFGAVGLLRRRRR